MRNTIFKDRTEMPSQDQSSDPVDEPVRARQASSVAGPAGAMAMYRLGSKQMDVVNCCRPRRGHDY
jgi:hypothetical protein